MQAFIDACRQAPAFSRMQRMLAAVVQRPGLHARFLNSLSRLEYVGVRKMLKARRAEAIDLDGLQHILEEAAHAARLKKLARSVAPRGVSVETFAPEHTLEGEAAESYFQAVDRAAAGAISGSDSEACYALTSAAIEIRARCLYPAYQELLRAAGSSVSVASITSDEEQHLREMERLLPERLPEWREQLAAVMRAEAVAFERLLDSFEAAIARE